jgi:hypothetical protein
LDFAPPVDVHWVWHVHMLAPVQYRADCQAVAGRILGHYLRSVRHLDGQLNHAFCLFSTGTMANEFVNEHK